MDALSRQCLKARTVFSYSWVPAGCPASSGPAIRTIFLVSAGPRRTQRARREEAGEGEEAWQDWWSEASGGYGSEWSRRAESRRRDSARRWSNRDESKKFLGRGSPRIARAFYRYMMYHSLNPPGWS